MIEFLQDGWYFVNPTQDPRWADLEGPYPTEAAAGRDYRRLLSFSAVLNFDGSD